MSAIDPNLPTPADRWAADAYRHLVDTLRRILPTPPDSSPAHLARLDNAILARFDALTPANLIEAEIAADYIAASEHARDCLRVALAPETSPQWTIKCRAQHNAMMRQAHGALSKLSRMQIERGKLEQDDEARAFAAATEQHIIRLIAQAIAEQPPEPDADLLDQLEPADEPDPDTLTPEQQKATIHRQRSALIRRLQGVLKDPSFKEAAAQAFLAAGDSLSAELHRQSARAAPG